MNIRRSRGISAIFAVFYLLSGCSSGTSNDTQSADSNANATPPDFGQNVTIIDSSMSVDDINTKLQSIATQSNGFDEVRNAVYFMPGTYGSAAGASDPSTATGFIDSQIGFHETVQGLGASPDDVVVNGNLRVGTATKSALGTFWRSLGNMKINPIEADEAAHTLRYNTSQACPIRRLDLAGNLDLSGGYGGGDVMANNRISGTVNAGFNWVTDTSPTYGALYNFIRDSEIGGWQGHMVNHVFSGVVGAPEENSNPNDITTFPTTLVSRDAPFLYFNNGQYSVFVPSVQTNVSGYHWDLSSKFGRSLPISSFYIAKSTSDTAESLNAALSQGKNLVLTPGVYKLDEAIHVSRADTVIMGMGMASLTPTTGTPAVVVDDVPGVVISALTIDANITNSAVLVEVGSKGGSSGNSAQYQSDPTMLSDVFVRIGGIYAGNAATTYEINQDYALLDDNWLWRADHGAAGTTGWTVNTGAHGLIVNGNNVTALGLFVEHYQQEQVVWNGNGGRTIFYQSEVPYDPPSQAAYMNGSEDGYPAYEVADGVTSHYAAGMTLMTNFSSKSPIYVQSAIKTPVSPNVGFYHMTDGALLNVVGGFHNIINAIGGAVDGTKVPPSFNLTIRSMYQQLAFP